MKEQYELYDNTESDPEKKAIAIAKKVAILISKTGKSNMPFTDGPDDVNVSRLSIFS